MEGGRLLRVTCHLLNIKRMYYLERRQIFSALQISGNCRGKRAYAIALR